MRIRYATPNRQLIEQSVAKLRDEQGAWNLFPCLEWERGLYKDGYGMFKMPGRITTRVHRYAWELMNGSIPEGLSVLHHCDNRKCFRPSHLFLGTHEDNMADMAAKGRSCRITALHPEILPRGEAHPNSKLNDEKVREIRRVYSAGAGSAVQLATKFNVTVGLIRLVATGRIWRHVHR